MRHRFVGGKTVNGLQVRPSPAADKRRRDGIAAAPCAREPVERDIHVVRAVRQPRPVGPARRREGKPPAASSAAAASTAATSAIEASNNSTKPAATSHTEALCGNVADQFEKRGRRCEAPVPRSGANLAVQHAQPTSGAALQPEERPECSRD